ncbi:ABC transporter substrate-binding protein [Erythrobacter sp.]|jgi:iron complex transport system substrate-binding protein|uniref:ABC transporter substrate-binding protein n=1 Tax=Erythrobacter sp. TaxID=1042 RepID=UPI002EC58CA3|nr:ABC transporter substrate-binding protein [Erythrobacter sp.]
MQRLGILLLALAALAGCDAAIAPVERTVGTRIVSLDYCADQYVLRLAAREDIAALSPEARRRYSYMREAAAGLRQVRPRAADVLALEPDIVVRSYGGGPQIAGFLRRSGVRVVELGYPRDLEGVRGEIERIGRELGREDAGAALLTEFDAWLAALSEAGHKRPSALYTTPTGVTAGEGTLIDELLRAAGFSNFQRRGGWNPIPLERLAYEQPDIVAAAFFEGKNYHAGSWSAARHPVLARQLEATPLVPLEGAWTSCGAWFLLDAVEALAAARRGPG